MHWVDKAVGFWSVILANSAPSGVKVCAIAQFIRDKGNRCLSLSEPHSEKKENSDIYTFSPNPANNIQA